jgi:hypothetical protein
MAAFAHEAIQQIADPIGAMWASAHSPKERESASRCRSLRGRHGRRTIQASSTRSLAVVLRPYERHEGEPHRKTIERHPFDHLAARPDRAPQMPTQIGDRPVVDRHTDDRTSQQTSMLEPVQRPKTSSPS